jgi:hypothetical protein
MHNFCAAIIKRLHSDFAAIAQRFRSDSIAMPIAQRF